MQTWDPNHLIDQKFYKNKLKYILQCSLATLAIFATLLSLNILPNDVVIASIGATSFMVFAIPHRDISRERFVVGGYAIGIFFGSLCFYFSTFFLQSDNFFLMQYNDEIFGALAVGLTMFFMVILNFEHPPAAAAALGLVIDEWSLRALLVTVLAIFLILAYRHLFKRYMINLL